MLPAEIEALVAADQAHVWHPYAPSPSVHPPLVVESAEGVRLHLADGRELVDGMSSWWAAIHGYRHPVLDAAVTDQLARMSHVMFGGLTHPPAVRLAEQLVALTPEPLQHVFFTDSGSVAVEVAIKMALQYWQARGEPGKARLLTVRGGYHGDTMGAMAVCDPVDGMHQLFVRALATQLFAERPPADYRDAYADQLRAQVAAHAHELAAVIVEPVVQGAGGMRFYDPAYLRLLRELCDEHRLLLVLDEIATGFGRSGVMFACEHAGVVGDLMCVGKALTGGYLSLAATLCTEPVAATISAAHGAFMHGPTFMGNPLATAVAGANLGLLADGHWPEQVSGIEKLLTDGLAEAAGYPHVAEVRVLGAIGVVQLRAPVDLPRATAAAVAQGVWLRPFRDLIYTMPPYVCQEQDVARLCDGILAAVRAEAP